MDRVGQEHQIAVDVGVDEPRDDIKARRVDDLPRHRVSNPTDLEDHPIQDRHVRPKGRPAGAVDHPSVLQDQVEFHRFPQIHRVIRPPRVAIMSWGIARSNPRNNRFRRYNSYRSASISQTIHQ